MISLYNILSHTCGASRVVDTPDIANMMLCLCSEKVGFISGKNICIDGDMKHQMICHGDHGQVLDTKETNI